jgi:cellulose synthase/poly-beta-1,6-N-acetylglucosamine synthase-like glycosyltransferase
MELNNIFSFVWYFFQFFIGFNLVMPFLFLIIFLITNKKKHSPTINPAVAEVDYAIIVTAYEQTDLLKEVVKSILEINYNNYLIYVVADKCDISNLHFDDNRVILLRPEETLASNTRSHFYAIDRFKRPHERLTIIDSDNLVHPEYINELNKFFSKGYLAVQGLREAKNLNSIYANLDAARDIYYHFYDGEVLFNIGSSATLSGSGMAFTVRLYKECLEHLDIVGAGFDKILQKQIVEKKLRIAFAKKAIVYDEKTSKSDQLVKQRARWINTWFKYFSFGFAFIYKGILQLNWNKFLFGIVLVRPPLFLFIILSLFFLGINIFFNSLLAIIWAVAMIVFVIGFLSALIINNANSTIYKSLLGIPRFIFFQLVSLAKVRNANKHSVATKHSVNKY